MKSLDGKMEARNSTEGMIAIQEERRMQKPARMVGESEEILAQSEQGCSRADQFPIHWARKG